MLLEWKERSEKRKKGAEARVENETNFSSSFPSVHRSRNSETYSSGRQHLASSLRSTAQANAARPPLDLTLSKAKLRACLDGEKVW
jgi:hypothetical protein